MKPWLSHLVRSGNNALALAASAPGNKAPVTFTVEKVGSARDDAYLSALAAQLQRAGDGYEAVGTIVRLEVVRLRPDPRNRRLNDLQILFRLESDEEPLFGMNLGAGPAQTNDDPEDWAELRAINFSEGMATKKRLPKDCRAAADSEGIIWF